MINNHTVIIMNNTQDVIICTFNPLVSIIRGRILAVEGFDFTMTSLIPAIIMTFLTPLDWDITISDFAIAILGVVDATLAVADLTIRFLFLDDIVFNTSSIG